jgi:HK97 gp10 family phage protein
LSIGVKVIRKPSYKTIEGAYRKAAEQIIASGLQDTMNTAKQSIQTNSGGGRTYEKYNPKRTHTASSAGNPPNTDTGFLVSNIHVVLDIDGLGGSVESRADYSGFLEFGTSKMQARPYLQPALEQNKPKIRAKFRRLKAKGV